MSVEAQTINPFPGLRPFRQDEDYLFFGREKQTMELLKRLGSNRFVAVVGTSGSGKSSLVRCGLISELLGGKMLQAGASWEIAVTHPGGNPQALLAEALVEADLYDPDQENVREQLLATLSRSHFGLVEAVKQARLGEQTNFLLVVDQFEEIFRFHEAGQMQQEVANEFISILLEAVAQQQVPIYVVLTMRSDFIGECGTFEGLAEMVNRGEFLIPRLTREQYKRVIEGPIKVAGGELAPRLLQRLLNDLGQQADQLPCLQHALMRTWDIWSKHHLGNALDLDDYYCIGKMAEALSLHADEIYASLASDRQRELCQGSFQALTVQESENRGIRRPQRLSGLCQILEVNLEELLPILDAYRQHGVTFLMPSPEVELTEQTIVDISHESLMRVWTRLRHWVVEEAQAAGIYRRLSESAELREQGKAGLYRSPELGIALAWREARRPNAAWAQRYHPNFDRAMEFLEASKQASVAAGQAEEAARRRELEQARVLAEFQQQQLEEQQRSARRLRIMLGGLAFVALVAAVACAAALIANNRANTLAQEAQQQRDAARNAEAAAERARETAVVAHDTLARKVYISAIRRAASMIDADRLGDAEKLLLELDPEERNWEWGHLMARAHPEALELVAPILGYKPVEGKGLTGVQLSPDRSKLAVFHTGRGTLLWDLETGEQIADLGDQASTVGSAAFSPDGSRFATSSVGFDDAPRHVHVWNTATGDLVRTIEASANVIGGRFVYKEIIAIRFNRAGSHLMTCSGGKRCRGWNLATGEMISENTADQAFFAWEEGSNARWLVSPVYPLEAGNWAEVSAAPTRPKTFPPEMADAQLELNTVAWNTVPATGERIDLKAFHEAAQQRLQQEARRGERKIHFVDSQSAESGEGAQQAIDGNPRTYWHTSWDENETSHSHEIQIDLGQVRQIEGFLYVPRTLSLEGRSDAHSRNGRIGNYEFYVSTDGEDWGEPIRKGKFPAGDETQRILFDEKHPARYIRLVALDEINGNPWTSVAELDAIYELDQHEKATLDLPKLENAATYLKTRFWSPSARQARLRILHDDSLQVWLNDQQILTDPGFRIATSEQVPFQQGWNDLLLKVVNSKGDWLVRTDFLSLQGQPIEDLTFSTDETAVDPPHQDPGVVVVRNGNRIDLLDPVLLTPITTVHAEGQIFGLQAGASYFCTRQDDYIKRVTVVQSYRTVDGSKAWRAEIPYPESGGRYQNFFPGPDGDRIVVENPQAAVVYDLAQGKKISELKEYNSGWSQRSFTFSADSSLLVDFNGSRTRVWDVRSGDRLAELIHGEATLHDTGQTLGQEWLVTSAVDGSVKLWDLRPFWADFNGAYNAAFPFQYPSTYAAWPLAVGEAMLDPTSSRLALANVVGKSCPALLDLLKGTTQALDISSFGEARLIRFSVDGSRLAMAHEAGPTTLWDAATGDRLASLPETEPWDTPFELNRDGTRLATLACFIPSSHRQWKSKIWNGQTGELVTELASPSNGLRAGRFTADGQQFVGYSRGGIFYSWDTASGVLLNEHWPHNRAVNWGAFSADSSLAVSCSDDHTAIVWDTKTWEKVSTLVGHTGPVRFAQFSPDSRWVVSDALDDTHPVRIWDVKTGRQPFLLSGITRHLYAVAFTPDGRRIVLGLGDPNVEIPNQENTELERSLKMSGNTRIKVFELETGAELIELKEPFNAFGISALAFEAGGTRLLASRYLRESTLWGAVPWNLVESASDEGQAWLTRIRQWQLAQFKLRRNRPLQQIEQYDWKQEISPSENAGPPWFGADFDTADALDHWLSSAGWTVASGQLTEKNASRPSGLAIVNLKPETTNYVFEVDVTVPIERAAVFAFGWKENMDQHKTGGRGLGLSITPTSVAGNYKIEGQQVDSFSLFQRRNFSDPSETPRQEIEFHLRVEVRPYALFVFIDGKLQQRLVYATDYPPRLWREMPNFHVEVNPDDQELGLKRSLAGAAGFVRSSSRTDRPRYDNLVVTPLRPRGVGVERTEKDNGDP